MSLEGKIDQLIEAIEQLTDVILNHGEMAEKGSYENPYSVSTGGNIDEGVTVVKGDLETEEPLPTIMEPMKEEIQGTDSKTMELINLSKRMGYPYLMQDGKLIVDNEVLNTYSRQGYKDEV